MRESGELISKGKRRIARTINRVLKNNKKITEAMIKDAIISDLQLFLYEQTERHPMILPMLVTI